MNRPYIEQIPIYAIKSPNGADKKHHDRLISLVEAILSLHEKLSSAKAPHAKSVLERQIAQADRQIDQLVYELYGLTEEEIKIVERASS